MGKIVGAHGIKGVVKVFSYAESTINWIKPHSKTILMSLEGVTDRNQAEGLSGSELFIDRKSLKTLEAGSYYWSDIIGLSVFTVEGEYIGRVASIVRTGSNDVYVVKNKEKREPAEILIPALDWVVLEIDIDKKVMRVDLPEGLRDL